MSSSAVSNISGEELKEESGGEGAQLTPRHRSRDSELDTISKRKGTKKRSIIQPLSELSESAANVPRKKKYSMAKSRQEADPEKENPKRSIAVTEAKKAMSVKKKTTTAAGSHPSKSYLSTLILLMY